MVRLGGKLKPSPIFFAMLLMFTLAVSFCNQAQGEATPPLKATLLLDDSAATVTLPYVSAGGLDYFVAQTAAHGWELWVTDGTPKGTHLVKDINPGPADSEINLPYKIDSDFGLPFILFSADDGQHGLELWRSDGTADGTYMVKDINPGAASSFYGSLIVYRDKVVFVATDVEHGAELWISDGTNGGTGLVKDIWPGPNSSHPYPRIEVNGKVLLEVSRDGEDQQGRLWATDGTSEGTVLLSTTPYMTDGDILVGRDGHYYTFIYMKPETATTPRDLLTLWTSDATTAGTRIVKQFYPGNKSVNLDGWTKDNHYNYFGVTHIVDQYDTKFETWRTDGTSSGTTLFLDRRVDKIGLAGDVFYLSLGTNQVWNLYRFDGPPENPTIIDLGFPDFTGPKAVGRKLFFNFNNNKDLYCTQGTTETTVLVKHFAGGIPGPEFVLENRLVFLARETADGPFQLWQSDGTPEGTSVFSEINLTNSWSHKMRSVDKHLFIYNAQGLWIISEPAASAHSAAWSFLSNLHESFSKGNKG